MGENSLDNYSKKLNRFESYQAEDQNEFETDSKRVENVHHHVPRARIENIVEEKTDKKAHSPLATASLTLGIISILSAFFYYISLPAGIIGLVSGVKSVKKTGSKAGKAGEILSIIGLAICVFLYVSIVLLLVINNSDL